MDDVAEFARDGLSFRESQGENWIFRARNLLFDVSILVISASPLCHHLGDVRLTGGLRVKNA